MTGYHVADPGALGWRQPPARAAPGAPTRADLERGPDSREPSVRVTEAPERAAMDVGQSSTPTQPRSQGEWHRFCRVEYGGGATCYD
jgi:hypothetical protein